MTDQQKNLSLFILVALNIILLLKFSSKQQTELSLPNPIIDDEADRIFLLDTLVLERWRDKKILTPPTNTPLYLFFYSKRNCKSCLDDPIDFMAAHGKTIKHQYIICIDSLSETEKQVTQARYRHIRDFYTIYGLKLNPPRSLKFPFMMIVDSNKQVILSHYFPSIPEVEKEYPFWARAKFIYTLAAKA